MRAVRALVAASVALALTVGVSSVASAKRSDKAAAEKALLTKADLPNGGEGWSREKPDPAADREADRIRKGIFECFDIRRVTASSKRYRAQGPTFARKTRAGHRRVNDIAYVFPNVRAARSYLAPFLADDGIECFRKTLLEQLERGTVRGTKVLVQSVEKPPGLGDSSVGYALPATLTNPDGREQTIYFDAIAVRVGRGVTGLTFQSPSESFPDERAVVEAAMKRLERVL